MAAYASYRIGFTSIAGDRPSNAVGQDDRTSTGTKQNPLTSFRVAGRSGMHSNLMSAVADADDGDTIEVTHAGPFVQPTIRAFGKKLTIKSAAGVKPVFVVDQNSLAFLQTDSSLTLDGLFIECESPVRRGVGEDVFNNSVIACRGESLTVNNCVIRLSRNQIGIFTTSRQCSITNTHVVGDRCRCLLITATTGIEAHIERCVLRGGMPSTFPVRPQRPKTSRPSESSIWWTTPFMCPVIGVSHSVSGMSIVPSIGSSSTSNATSCMRDTLLASQHEI